MRPQPHSGPAPARPCIAPHTAPAAPPLAWAPRAAAAAVTPPPASLTPRLRVARAGPFWAAAPARRSRRTAPDDPTTPRRAPDGAPRTPPTLPRSPTAPIHPSILLTPHNPSSPPPLGAAGSHHLQPPLQPAPSRARTVFFSLLCLLYDTITNRVVFRDTARATSARATRLAGPLGRRGAPDHSVTATERRGRGGLPRRPVSAHEHTTNCRSVRRAGQPPRRRPTTALCGQVGLRRWREHTLERR